MKKLLLIVVLVQSWGIFAGVNERLAAMAKGDYKTAYKEFLPLAENGDDRAMTTRQTHVIFKQASHTNPIFCHKKSQDSQTLY